MADIANNDPSQPLRRVGAPPLLIVPRFTSQYTRIYKCLKLTKHEPTAGGELVTIAQAYCDLATLSAKVACLDALPPKCYWLHPFQSPASYPSLNTFLQIPMTSPRNLSVIREFPTARTSQTTYADARANTELPLPVCNACKSSSGRRKELRGGISCQASSYPADRA